MSEDCVCGHAADEHGGEPDFPGSTACTIKGCDCIAYEREEAMTAAKRPKAAANKHTRAREWWIPKCGGTVIFRANLKYDDVHQPHLIRVREVLPRRAATTKRRKK